MCDSIRVPAGTLMYEAVRVKLKLQWRPQDVGDDKDV
jgi:hypothetical protein